MSFKLTCVGIPVQFAGPAELPTACSIVHSFIRDTTDSLFVNKEMKQKLLDLTTISDLEKRAKKTEVRSSPFSSVFLPLRIFFRYFLTRNSGTLGSPSSHKCSYNNDFRCSFIQAYKTSQENSRKFGNDLGNILWTHSEIDH